MYFTGVQQFDQLSSTNIGVNCQVRYLDSMLSPEVCLIAMIIQALITGAYFTSFLMCLRWLVFSDDGGTLWKRINWPFFFITVLLFSLSVTELSISLHVTLLISGSRGTGNAYATIIAVRNSTLSSSSSLNSVQDFIELFSPIITDGVLVCEWNEQTR